MKLLKDKRKAIKSYSFLSMLANFLVALSISGLGVMGVLSIKVALSTLLLFVIPLGIFGLVGRFIDQELEDECEEVLPCHFLGKSAMPDGYTETTHIRNLNTIVDIYEKHGGVLRV